MNEPTRYRRVAVSSPWLGEAQADLIGVYPSTEAKDEYDAEGNCSLVHVATVVALLKHDDGRTEFVKLAPEWPGQRVHKLVFLETSGGAV